MDINKQKKLFKEFKSNFKLFSKNDNNLSQIVC